MTAQQLKALITGCKAALDLEAKPSPWPQDRKRALSIVSVCQFCLESATVPKPDGTGGWFTSKMSLPPFNNPFGIQAMKDFASYGAFDEPSWEIENGIRVEKVESFQRFPDLATAFKLHQNLLLMKSPVMHALENGDWIAVCVALGPPIDANHCGYSTNPAYAKVLTSIGSQCGLDRPGWMEWYAAGADPHQHPA